jgi:hypothetical protein
MFIVIVSTTDNKGFSHEHLACITAPEAIDHLDLVEATVKLHGLNLAQVDGVTIHWDVPVLAL